MRFFKYISPYLAGCNFQELIHFNKYLTPTPYKNIERTITAVVLRVICCVVSAQRLDSDEQRNSK